MNPERLLQNFDRLINTPDAVPRLRRFILDLAVRGKLVEQNPEDEPAAELLKRIRVEKQRRSERARSAEDEPRATTKTDTSFEIPQNWEWVYATEPTVLISDNGKKVQTKDVLNSGAFPVVDQGKMFIRGYCNDERKVIHIVEPVIIFGDHTRETKLVDFDFVVGADGVKILQPIIIEPDYCLIALQWLPLNSRGYARHFKQLRASFFPLPPLAEQHRIVAKVDELMKLCDELEAAQAKRERRRDRLVAATLHGMNNGKADEENGEDFSFNDSVRFYFNHLPRLTTRPEHIKQLCQTILNLAVRGKLVQQDPKDEPASELLKLIVVEKERLFAEGVIKKQEPIPVAPGEMPYPLPNGWSWCRIQDIFISVTDGDHLPPPKTDDGVPFLVIGNIHGRSLDFTNCRYVSETYYFGLNIIRRPQEGDILYTLVGSYGIPVLLLNNRPFCVQRHISILRPPKKISAGYLSHALNSLFVFDQATACATGIAQKTVPLNGLRKILIPLPPLAEQHRIVEKVDELMKLCDELEVRITTNTTTKRKLLEATLQEALNGCTHRMSNGKKRICPGLSSV